MFHPWDEKVRCFLHPAYILISISSLPIFKGQGACSARINNLSLREGHSSHQLHKATSSEMEHSRKFHLLGKKYPNLVGKLQGL